MELEGASIDGDRTTFRITVSNQEKKIVLFACNHKDYLTWFPLLQHSTIRCISNHINLVLVEEGVFATVYCGIHRRTSQLVAIESIKRHSDYAAQNRRWLVISKLVKHRNIIRTIKVFESLTHLHIEIE